MNGARKFHKANGPAFAPMEEWKSADGRGVTCWIVGVRCYGTGKWDYDVTYKFADGTECTKNAWSFQVRYEHIADEKI